MADGEKPTGSLAARFRKIVDAPPSKRPEHKPPTIMIGAGEAAKEGPTLVGAEEEKTWRLEGLVSRAFPDLKVGSPEFDAMVGRMREGFLNEELARGINERIREHVKEFTELQEGSEEFEVAVKQFDAWLDAKNAEDVAINIEEAAGAVAGISSETEAEFEAAAPPAKEAPAPVSEVAPSPSELAASIESTPLQSEYARISGWVGKAKESFGIVEDEESAVWIAVYYTVNRLMPAQRDPDLTSEEIEGRRLKGTLGTASRFVGGTEARDIPKLYDLFGRMGLEPNNALKAAILVLIGRDKHQVPGAWGDAAKEGLQGKGVGLAMVRYNLSYAELERERQLASKGGATVVATWEGNLHQAVDHLVGEAASLVRELKEKPEILEEIDLPGGEHPTFDPINAIVAIRRIYEKNEEQTALKLYENVPDNIKWALKEDARKAQKAGRTSGVIEKAAQFPRSPKGE